MSSLRNVTAAHQRYLTSPLLSRQINIIVMEQFAAANNVFCGSLKRTKRSGQNTSMGHPEISEEDLKE